MKKKPCLEVDGSAFYVFIKEAGEFGILYTRYVGIIFVKLMKTYIRYIYVFHKKEEKNNNNKTKDALKPQKFLIKVSSRINFTLAQFVCILPSFYIKTVHNLQEWA